jgi:hypothetical protein
MASLQKGMDWTLGPLSCLLGPVMHELSIVARIASSRWPTLPTTGLARVLAHPQKRVPQWIPAVTALERYTVADIVVCEFGARNGLGRVSALDPFDYGC